MRNKLYKLFYYSHSLGFFAAIKIIASLFFRKKNEIAALKVPGIVHPVHIRAKSSDENAFRQIFVNKEYAFDYEYGQPKTMIDAGANIGLAAVFFANRYPDLQIICLEPEAGNMEMLKLNTRNYPNITAIEAGLWSKKTNLIVKNIGLGNWGFVVEECSAGEKDAVAALSLPAIMDEFKLERLDIVKMDIEGSEKEVMEAPDVQRWLTKCNVLIIEIHDRMKSGTSKSLFHALMQNDYHTLDIKGENLICMLPKKAR